MTVRELINSMNEKENICIDDLEEKNVFITELYCGAAGDLKHNNPILNMEVIGIVAVNDLICAADRKKCESKAVSDMIGNKIKHLMKKNGYTQKQLAMRSECTECAISRYVNNKREPSIKILKNLAIALGVTVDELLKGE